LLGWGLHPDNQIVVKNCEIPQVLTTNDPGSNFVFPSKKEPVENNVHYRQNDITINVYIENGPIEDPYVFCEEYPYDSSCIQENPDDLYEVISDGADDMNIIKKPDQTITREEYEEGSTRPPSVVTPEHDKGTKTPEVDPPTYDSDADITMSVQKGK
jgi:hypothetical protein